MKVTTVDAYIDSKTDWKVALLLLRELFLQTTLEETIKWGMPVYTLNEKNVAGFSAFKSYVGIWFYQGVFLKDPENKLINAQEGTTRGLRQWRFQSASEIQESKESIRFYLEEAIQNQKIGKEIKPKKKIPLELPHELAMVFQGNRELEQKFNELSPGRRREYSEYILSAKRSETRAERVKKIVPLIQKGFGLNDRYNKS